MSPVTLNSTALLTDQYELTMLAGALADGSASRRCTFEVPPAGWLRDGQPAGCLPTLHEARERVTTALRALFT